MATVAGLVLGAVALVGPTYDAINSLCKRISDGKKFPKTLRRIKTTLDIQKALLCAEYLQLFPSHVEEAFAKEMLGLVDHPNWFDKEFEDIFTSHLGDHYERICEAIKLIHETVMMFQE